MGAQVRIVLGDPAWQLKLRSVLLFTAGHHHPYHHPHAQSIFQKIWNSIRRISNAVFSDHFNAMQINRIDFSWMWTILTPYIWIPGSLKVTAKMWYLSFRWHQAENFDTGTAGGAGDKYQVCLPLKCDKTKLVCLFVWSTLLLFSTVCLQIDEIWLLVS